MYSIPYTRYKSLPFHTCYLHKRIYQRKFTCFGAILLTLFSQFLTICFTKNVKSDPKTFLADLLTLFYFYPGEGGQLMPKYLLPHQRLQRAPGESHTANRVSILYICRVLGHLSQPTTWQVRLTRARDMLICTYFQPYSNHWGRLHSLQSRQVQTSNLTMVSYLRK